jgi:hypothetical protein
LSILRRSDVTNIYSWNKADVEEASEEGEEKHNLRKDEKEHTHTKPLLDFFCMVPLSGLENDGTKSNHRR